jgi:hypothetical protein
MIRAAQTEGDKRSKLRCHCSIVVVIFTSEVEFCEVAAPAFVPSSSITSASRIEHRSRSLFLVQARSQVCQH